MGAAWLNVYFPGRQILPIRSWFFLTYYVYSIRSKTVRDFRFRADHRRRHRSENNMTICLIIFIVPFWRAANVYTWFFNGKTNFRGTADLSIEKK